MHGSIPVPLALTRFPRGRRGVVAAVAWERLSIPEARRLRELGLDTGVAVELIRRPGMLGGPLACRIGRMTIALRRHVADAIDVLPQGG